VDEIGFIERDEYFELFHTGLYNRSLPKNIPKNLIAQCDLIHFSFSLGFGYRYCWKNAKSGLKADIFPSV
jgi:hypothetical protein